ncbi:MAG: hypothetical protein WBA25_18930, partial [Jannaschia sp.]
MCRIVALLLLLSACAADLPPAEGTISSAARAETFPVLLPLDPLLEGSDIPSRAAETGPILIERGTRLSQVTIPAPATATLADRGRRLRERADVLRAAP